MATTIEIDFEVFKELTAKRENENVTYNDVVRDLLGLARKPAAVDATAAAVKNGDLVRKGVLFPEGTELRAQYKGQTYYGKVEKGHLVVNGRKTVSPSEAARIVTSTSVNGWMFWECRLPGESGWRLLKSLRKSRS